MSNAAEFFLIGALCVRPQGMHEVDVLPEHFASEMAREAYKVIAEMVSGGQVVDLLTVSLELQARTGRQWMTWLHECVNRCPAPTNAVFYAAQVRTGYTLNRAREIAESLQAGIDATNTEGHIDTAIASLMDLRRSRIDHEWSARKALEDALDVVRERMSNGGKVCGIPSGLKALDAILGGFQDTDLITVGARSGMGKTAFMLNLAMNAGTPAGIISSEQGYRQIGERLYAIAGRVNTSAMRTGRMEADDFDGMSAAVNFRDWDSVRINDKPSINIMDVARQAREWKHKHDIRVLFVDYIQRIQPMDPRAPRREQVDEVVVGLKNVARELRIPVIALAQVNRAVEQRKDARPNMSDLKESGKIEEESDVILTLYREDYYNPETDRKGIVEVDILKNRHGPTGCIDTVWLAEFLRFEGIAKGWEE